MTGVKEVLTEWPFPTSKSRRGLALLVQAYEYAQEVGRDAWEFAVEIPVLERVDFSLSDVRWLLCKGFAQHARETTSPADTCRSFRHESHLALRKRSCVVLTELGIAFARQLNGICGVSSFHLRPANGTRSTGSQPIAEQLNKGNGDTRPTFIPCWDYARQELRLGNDVVKEFRLHCPNQAIILAAFEEERWPPRIDDPLPHREDMEPKQRLHDTIKSLNRNQKCHLIRFRGDGTGQGVRWECH